MGDDTEKATVVAGWKSKREKNKEETLMSSTYADRSAFVGRANDSAGDNVGNKTAEVKTISTA